MFPQLRERLGSALDIVVEFSTLGEYRLGADGAVWPASALAPAIRTRPARPAAARPAPEREPQLGGAGDRNAARAAVRRIVAGGAAGPVPVATPAARRLSPEHACRGERARTGLDRTGRRLGKPAHREQAHPRRPAAPEQLCFAV
jgi:hypothetical protein